MPLLINLPLYIFLFLFFGFLVIFLIFLFINLYHIFETSSLTLASLTVVILIFAVSAFTLFTTWYLLQDVNWQTQITIFDSSWITNIFNFN
ncbi:MAG: hypothetical protein Q7J14_00935 [Candidatus Magasanikbacteria bacterium]|nr:hypothetical protein [Candidatus Magasanikbacteria bacterium]